MAMSRFLSQSLPRTSLRLPASLISHPRNRSSKARRGQLAEVEIDAASSSQSDSPEAAAESITVGLFEEAVRNIIVRRAAPDWLPFLPGYSYWVPPRATSFRSSSPSGSITDAIAQLASPGGAMTDRWSSQDLSEDEQMSLTSTKGWPSSAFYIGTSPMHHLPVVEMEVKIQDSEDNEDGTSNSVDEEG